MNVPPWSSSRPKPAFPGAVGQVGEFGGELGKALAVGITDDRSDQPRLGGNGKSQINPRVTPGCRLGPGGVSLGHGPQRQGRGTDREVVDRQLRSSVAHVGDLGPYPEKCIDPTIHLQDDLAGPRVGDLKRVRIRLGDSLGHCFRGGRQRRASGVGTWTQCLEHIRQHHAAFRTAALEGEVFEPGLPGRACAAR